MAWVLAPLCNKGIHLYRFTIGELDNVWPEVEILLDIKVWPDKSLFANSGRVSDV